MARIVSEEESTFQVASHHHKHDDSNGSSGHSFRISDASGVHGLPLFQVAGSCTRGATGSSEDIPLVLDRIPGKRL